MLYKVRQLGIEFHLSIYERTLQLTKKNTVVAFKFLDRLR